MVTNGRCPLTCYDSLEENQSENRGYNSMLKGCYSGAITTCKSHNLPISPQGSWFNGDFYLGWVEPRRTIRKLIASK